MKRVNSYELSLAIRTHLKKWPKYKACNVYIAESAMRTYTIQVTIYVTNNIEAIVYTQIVPFADLCHDVELIAPATAERVIEYCTSFTERGTAP